jgi:hypothetical protein
MERYKNPDTQHRARKAHSLSGSISRRFKAYCGALGINPKNASAAIANLNEREALRAPEVPPHPSGHLATFRRHR